MPGKRRRHVFAQGICQSCSGCEDPFGNDHRTAATPPHVVTMEFKCCICVYSADVPEVGRHGSWRAFQHRVVRLADPHGRSGQSLCKHTIHQLTDDESCINMRCLLTDAFGLSGV